MLPSEHFLCSRRSSSVLGHCRNENLLLSLSYNPLCPLSRLESLVQVFSQCRMVDFGPSSSLCNHGQWYDVSAATLMYKHPIFPQKFWLYFSPWLAPSLEPPACPPSLSLLLPDQSQTLWHPFTLPFMSHGQWVWGQRHTFQSDSGFSVSSGLDRGVCSASVSVCWYFFFVCLFWASAVLAAQGQLLERVAQLLFLWSIILSFWGESCHFNFCHLDFFLPVLNSVSKPVWVIGMEFSLVILGMFWLHACAMTRLLSVLLCSRSGTQHTHVRCRHCVDVRTSTLKMSDSFVKTVSTVSTDPYARLLIQMHAIPLSLSSVICFTPTWPRLSICFETAISEGTVSEVKRGNGLRVELSMWRTWRVFCRGLFSIWTMFGDAEERVWTFGRIFVVLSVCHLLFQPCSFSRKPEPKAEVQEGTLHVKRHTAMFKAL